MSFIPRRSVFQVHSLKHRINCTYDTVKHDVGFLLLYIERENPSSTCSYQCPLLIWNMESENINSCRQASHLFQVMLGVSLVTHVTVKYCGPCDLRSLHFESSLYFKTDHQWLHSCIVEYPCIFRPPSISNCSFLA